MKKLIFIVFMGLSLILNAQISPYLDKGVSGIGITAGYEQTEGLDAIFATASYSCKGNIDIYASFGQVYFSEYGSLTNPDATGLEYYGGITWWALRENPTPGIDANFGLHAEIFGGKAIDYTIQEGYYLGYFGGNVGIDANVVFNLPNKWSLQPMYSLYYELGNDYLDYITSTAKEPFFDIASSIGVSVIKKMNNGNSIVASFLQYMNNYNSQNCYHATISYVFAL